MKIQSLLAAAALLAFLGLSSAQKPNEKAVVDFINKISANPKDGVPALEKILFRKYDANHKCLKPNLKDGYFLTEGGVYMSLNGGEKAVQDAIHFLNTHASVSQLRWNPDLWKGSRDIVEYQGSKGGMTIAGPNGQEFTAMVGKYGHLVSPSGALAQFGLLSPTEQVV